MTGSATDTAFDMSEAIRVKRYGGELTDEQIDSFITGYVDGSIPDYQASAMLMAIVWHGMTEAETLRLTQAMVESGDVLDPGAQLGRRIVDKHSTGGVGDKTSISLAPLVAACGVPVAKMSGRGLGHTGGTLDKLEAIPGFSIELSEHRFLEQVREIGVAIASQTGDLVPADKQLYALRDVTGTVESIPLIAASVMSKKLASGADAMVLDVKVGSGAFMKDLDNARELADEMIAIGRGAGRDVVVVVTEMSRPLGRAVGNALEVDEAVDMLRGGGPADFREVVLDSAAILLSQSDLDIDEVEGRRRAEAAIADGSAYERYRTWIAAQGGDPDAELERAPVQLEVPAPASGVITELDAFTVGYAAATLGAGRRTKDEDIDHAVGIVLAANVGERVEAGAPLLVVHARDDAAARNAADRILERTVIDADAPEQDPAATVIIERRG